MGTVEIVDSAGLRDTIESVNQRLLTLHVVAPSGAALRGAAVRFTVPLVPYANLDSSGVMDPARLWYNRVEEIGSITGHVDDAGLVSVGFSRSVVAGHYPLLVDIGQIGFHDTLTLTTDPGQAVALRVLPGDTAVYPGANLPLHAATVDRYGNPRPDPVTFVGSGPGLQLTGNTLLTAGPTVSRDSVTVSAAVGGGTRFATGYVSIVPRGELAIVRYTEDGNQLGTVGFDGSGLRLLTPVIQTNPPADYSLTWTPDGSAVVFSDSSAIFRLFPTSPPVRTRLAIPTAPGTTFEAEYSHDGTTLVTTLLRQGAGSTIQTRDSLGTSGVSQTPLPGHGLSYLLAWHPSPSHDGTRFAMITDELNGGLRVFDVTAAQPETWLVSGQRPRWSPTADVIAFTTQGNGPLHTVNADGTGEQTVSQPGFTYAEGELGWSGDGVWLVAREQSGVYHLVNVQTGLTLPLAFTSRMYAAAIRP